MYVDPFNVIRIHDYRNSQITQIHASALMVAMAVLGVTGYFISIRHYSPDTLGQYLHVHSQK